MSWLVSNPIATVTIGVAAFPVLTFDITPFIQSLVLAGNPIAGISMRSTDETERWDYQFATTESTGFDPPTLTITIDEVSVESRSWSAVKELFRD